MKKPIILIDPGHGGKHPGAVAAGIREADINLSVALHLGGILNNFGWDVRFTRSADATVGLYERAEIEQRIKPDLFLSVHCNSTDSPGPNGMEVFTTPGDTAADPAATCLHSSLKACYPDTVFRTDFSDGDPDKEENFYVLKHTDAPAVLVELGFLSNQEEREWLSKYEEQIIVAHALAMGVDAWLAGGGR